MSLRRQRADVVLLLFAFALALALRFLPLRAATVSGVRLLSPDCYAHLRRSASVARNFPRVPIVDPYLDHPDGGVWIWPPAFDLLIGGASRIVFGRTATTDQVAAVAATVPPILGALHVFPLYALARLALSRRRALLAVLAYAVLPTAILWSCFGHADHHVAETLVLLLFLAAASRAALAPPGPRRVAAATLAGACLGLALFTWQGAVFVAGLAVPWALLYLGPSAVLLGATGAAIGALATWLTLAGAKVPFSFVSFGWFQPALVAAGAIPLALAAAITVRTRRWRIAAFALAAVLALATVPAASRLAGALLRGSEHLVSKSSLSGADDFADGGFLSYPAEFLAVVAELKPLLSPATGATLLQTLEELSPGLILLPIALILWTRSVLGSPRHPRRGPRALLVLFGVTVLVMTLFQRRNVYYLSVFAALALAEGVARLRAGWRAGTLPRLALSAVTLALVIGPGLTPLRRIHAYVNAPGPDFLDLMRRLRDLDPPGIDPASLPPPPPGSIPGVFCPWAVGHFVTALAERPAAADPFVYGWRRQCRFFTTTDDTEALGILRATRCRYLITADLRAVLPTYAAAVGRTGAPISSMLAVRVHFSPSRSPLPFLTEVLRSRGAISLRDGTLVPVFRVFRVLDAP